jgi:hypothetical protein
MHPIQITGTQLHCDLLTGALSSVVPVIDRKPVFFAFHSLAHPGIRATRHNVSSRVVWPRVAADIAALVPKMSTLLMSQSQTARYFRHLPHSCHWQVIQSSPLDLVGPSALVPGQFQVPAYYDGQIIQVVRDGATEGHGDVIVHLNLAAAVALTFQDARSYHDR